MEIPSELMVFKGEEDARKFFYLYENVVTKGLMDNAKAGKIVDCQSREAFDFYFERFKWDNGPTTEAKNYHVVKDVMLKKVSTQKSDAEIMKDAIFLTYDGGDIQAFLTRVEIAYNQAEFNEHAKFGMLREALKTDQLLLQFVLFRGTKDYEEVKQYCTDYADNQKMMSAPSGSRGERPGNIRLPARTSNDTRIDDLCREVEKLHLLMSNGPRNQRQAEPFCHKCNKKGHYASQC